MKSCNNCYCYIVCRTALGAVEQRFSKPGSLDELEKLWQELALECKHFLDKKEVTKWKGGNKWLTGLLMLIGKLKRLRLK